MLRAAIVTASLVISGSSGHARDTLAWGDVGGWHVGVDPSLGFGCFITASFEGGTFFRLGFSPDPGGAYIGVGNASWKSIEAGKDYEITIVMDNSDPWKATASGVNDTGGYPILMAFTDKPQFIEEVRRKHGITVFYSGRQIARLSLRGSAKAIAEMVRCQQGVNELVRSTPAQPAPPADPFEGQKPDQTTPAKDPFAI